MRQAQQAQQARRRCACFSGANRAYSGHRYALTGEDEACENEAACCSICKDKKACCVYVPCGHAHFCIQCSKALCNQGGWLKCPVCNAPVENMYRIYQ